jgi:hypothetical protein
MVTVNEMKSCLWAAVVAVLVSGCESTDIENDGGTVTFNKDECASASEKAVAVDAGTDPPGVIATCDDHLPCTWDTQCTPCEALPSELHVKATCVNYCDLSPACFDAVTHELIYTGCTHFIYWSSPGVSNDCFPVKFPDDATSTPHSGICNTFGVCVEQPKL